MTLEQKTEDRHWFALYTKPRQEFKASLQLEELAIEHYLPTHIVKKQWSDRKKKITEPLFRSYIFVYADEKERLHSLTLSSTVRVVCFNEKPAVIPNWQIENLKKMLSENS